MVTACAALVDRFAGPRRRLIGASLCRLILALASLHLYVASYPQRAFLWGPAGVSPIAERAAWGPLAPSAGLLPSLSLYFLSDSRAWFEAVYHGGIIAALLFGVFGGTLFTFLHWVFFTSLLERLAITLEGGDNVARIILLLMLGLCTHAYFSPGARRRRERLIAEGPSAAALLHNSAAALAGFQVALIYLASGLAKLEGDRWLDGTAVYYATRFDAMHHLAGLDWTTASPAVVAGITFGVLSLEILYPALLWLRSTRRLTVALAVAMHVGIALKMGLVSFGLVMIAANALMLTDDDYRALARLVGAGRGAPAVSNGEAAPLH